MKTEDWKAKMMDYLYDELNPEERKAFEEELAQNTELKEELEAFQSGKEILGNWEDEKPVPLHFSIFIKILRRTIHKVGLNGSFLLLPQY